MENNQCPLHDRRKSKWIVDKRLPIVLITGFIIQAILFIWWAIKFSNDYKEYEILMCSKSDIYKFNTTNQEHNNTNNKVNREKNE